MNKKNVPKLVTGVVISLICIISLALSIYFSVLVTSTYKQAYWILGEVFNAFTFVGVGALIGVLLYNKKCRYEIFIALAGFVLTLTTVLVIYLVPRTGNVYVISQLINKFVPIMYIINGLSIVSLVKTVVPRVKKLIK